MKQAMKNPITVETIKKGLMEAQALMRLAGAPLRNAEPNHVRPSETSSSDEDQPAEHSGGGVDDALGLYLKQMGSIPLLNRERELRLAKHLENTRRRYRRASLFNWVMLRKVYEKFQEVKAGLVAPILISRSSTVLT